MSELTHESRYKTISRVNWVCTWVDTLLTLIKLTIGFSARSPALIADGLHSLSDLGTDILALVLGNLSKQGPDTNHPYGHARYETLGTALLGMVLILLAIVLGIENSVALVKNETTQPHWGALLAAMLSILSKESLFRYTIHYAKKTRSTLLEANAWHSRSDSLSSVAVFIGILFALAGFAFVEYLAALFVALLIGRMGGKLAWNAIQELIDRGVPEAQSLQYRDTLRSVKDILDVHAMRSRIMGADVYIDAHIVVAPKISISEAHQINDFAIDQLKKEHKEIRDVTLHIDFEADGNDPKETLLAPMRKTLIELLSKQGITEPYRLYMHYDKNQIEVELILTEAQWNEHISQQCNALKNSTPWIRSITIFTQR